MQKLKVSKKYEGIKFSKFVDSYFLGKINRKDLFPMIRKKLIRLNNVHIKDINVVLKENDELTFYLDDSYFTVSYKATLDIIYEDLNLLIVNKKAGVLSHGINNNHHSVLDEALTYLINKKEYDPKTNDFKPALCNRLDEFTSGLLIIAKNNGSAKETNRLIENNEIIKHYQAIVLGTFKVKANTLTDNYYFNEKLLKAEINPSDKETKKVVTKYQVLKEKDNLTLLDIELITGRTHQIRAHLSYYSHPLLGDNKYGNKKINDMYKKNHQILTAYKLIFNVKNPESLLYYLNGKTVEINPNIIL